MFGFIRLKQEEFRKAASEGISDVVISREDIYRQMPGADPILLLRKGFELSMDDLPRFLKNGAKMHQFSYKHSAEPLRKVASRPERPTQDRPLSRNGMGNPILERRYSPLVGKRALILEPDQKNLKRLIDCLFICGLKLDRIHPVRMTSNITWALEKYRPSILVIDYHLPGSIDGLSMLQAFSELSYLETLILTINPDQILSEEENDMITALCREKQIKLLTKPVSRFALHRLLDTKSVTSAHS